MKILILCDQGNNRSVTIAHHLKYWGHDVIPAGLIANTQSTLHMLYRWADRIIVTEPIHVDMVDDHQDKIQLWDVGPDNYPRPFNRELLAKVRKFMQDHKEEYRNAK